MTCAQSFQLRLTTLMRLTRRKRTYRSADQTRRKVHQQLARPRSFVPPPWVHRMVEVTVTTRRGWRCYHLSPRRPLTLDQPVVYLHGGAYVFEISPFHWLACARVARAAGVRVVVPIYPLAPLSTADNTVEVAALVTHDVAREGAGRQVTLIGDSAGGGLALAVAQRLRDEGISCLRRIVLISPWLDVSMTDPASAAIDRHDAMLHVPGVAEAGRIYAGALNVSDPRVSPIHGSLANLAPITVFSGTYDIVHPDALRLVQRGQEAGTRVDLHQMPKGQHVFPLLPIREGSQALRQIEDLVTSGYS